MQEFANPLVLQARGSTQVSRAIAPKGTTWTEWTKPAPTAGMEPSCCKSVILSPSVSPESVDQTLDDRRCLIVVFIPQSVGQTEDGVHSDIPIGGLKNLDVLQGAVQTKHAKLSNTMTMSLQETIQDGYHLLQFEQLLYAEGLHIFGQVIRNVATKTMTAPWLELLGTTKTDQGLATHTVAKLSVKDASNVKEWRVVLLRLLSESESDNRTTSLRPS